LTTGESLQIRVSVLIVDAVYNEWDRFFDAGSLEQIVDCLNQTIIKIFIGKTEFLVGLLKQRI